MDRRAALAMTVLVDCKLAMSAFPARNGGALSWVVNGLA
jgi:hypothetical protein